MPAAKPEAAAPADDAPHLLVVDDDRRIRDLLSRYLAREGYRVTTAGSASEARAKLDSLSFDLLVLDVMMPGETGFDLARSIRARSAPARTARLRCARFAAPQASSPRSRLSP